jgi:hypothetical protein
LILYLKADEDTERELVRRAVSDPKPLYYNEKFLDQKLGEYLAEAELDSPDRVIPDEFVRWIFPSLVAHRRPKYEAMAKRYGYTVNARLVEAIANEHDFLELVASALDR